jgi:hypothetical protein
MRIALLALATGLALSLAAPAFAEEFVPDSQRVATPQQASATVNADSQRCHHLVHEGALSPIVQCGSDKTWERARLLTQQSIIDMQHRSVIGPGH